MFQYNCCIKMSLDDHREPESPNGDAESGWPRRFHMDDPGTKWRLGHPPDYSQVDARFMAERSQHHLVGSLEETVQNVVKTWEMEILHKTDPRVRSYLLPLMYTEYRNSIVT